LAIAGAEITEAGITALLATAGAAGAAGVAVAGVIAVLTDGGAVPCCWGVDGATSWHSDLTVMI